MMTSLKLARVHYEAIRGETPTEYVSKLTYIPSTGSIHVELKDKFRTTVVFPAQVSLDTLWKTMRELNGGKLLPRLTLHKKVAQQSLF